jgi:hypothetical protein
MTLVAVIITHDGNMMNGKGAIEMSDEWATLQFKN